MPAVMLSASDDGRTVEATVGDEIVIQLAENASTGFRWAVDKIDDRLLTLEGASTSPPSDREIGATGLRRLVFRAEAAGSGRLALKLWRHWEGDASVSRRFAVNVNVKRR